MKKGIFTLTMLAAIAAVAMPNFSSKGGLYDVVAPSLAGDPVAGSAVVGMIYYDSVGDQFKGINKDGDSLSLSAVAGSGFVSSGGLTEKIERAKVSCTNGGAGSYAVSSSSWINTVGTVNGNGECAVTFQASWWASEPICTAVAFTSGGSAAWTNITAQNSGGVTVQCRTNVGACTAFDVNVICMGPQ
jgi:hypothetical protein